MQNTSNSMYLPSGLVDVWGLAVFAEGREKVLVGLRRPFPLVHESPDPWSAKPSGSLHRSSMAVDPETNEHGSSSTYGLCLQACHFCASSAEGVKGIRKSIASLVHSASRGLSRPSRTLQPAVLLGFSFPSFSQQKQVSYME